MSADSRPLYPDHLADLRKSGLTDETVTAMGVYSVPPADIARLLGWNPQQVQSAFAFPYYGTAGFVRLKVFPPHQDQRGHTVKYLQSKGTAPHLYVLPAVETVLANPATPLAIAEGEKKAAAMIQAGVMAVGVGGIWAWLESDTHALIPELDRIAWIDREVTLFFDSDIWHRPDLLNAVYALGKELEERGAKVFVAVIEQHGTQKAGIDDFIVANGTEALGGLKRVLLTHATFTQSKPWWKGWRSARQKDSRTSTSVPSELEGRTIHPALHFAEGWASVGAVDRMEGETVWTIVTSAGSRYTAREIAPTLFPKPLDYPDLTGRWPQEDLQAFLHGSRDALFAAMAALLVSKARMLFELKRPQEFALLAVWDIATYFHPLFHTFPRLEVTGERGSGKSKLQAFLAGTSFNALLRVNPTPAVLFRLVAALRPTLCLDEIESLASEDHKELLAIINSGYKQGGAVDRCEGEERQVVSYSVYAPMSLAGIKGLNAVTEDRAIVVVMQRSRDAQRLNAQIMPEDPDWGQLRAWGYRLALTRFQEVRRAYESVQLPVWLVGRERELWASLFAIGELVDQEGQLGLCDDLRVLARCQAEERDGMSAEAEALLGLLEGRLGQEATVKLRPGDLCEDLAKAMNWKSVTAQFVGAALRRLGFQKDKRGRLGKDTGSVYEVTRQQVEQVKVRYLFPDSLATLQQGESCNTVTG